MRRAMAPPIHIALALPVRAWDTIVPTCLPPLRRPTRPAFGPAICV